MKSIIYLVLLFVFTIVECEEIPIRAIRATDDQNSTAEKEDPQVPEDASICKVCKCKNNIDNPEVNCSGLKLKGFSKDEWIALNKTMPDLQIIRFDVNNVEKLIAFPLMLNVRELHFHHNDIVEIEPNAFKYLPKLQKLDLSWNHLDTKNLKTQIFEGSFDPDTYEALRYLTELDLSHNNLTGIHIDAFQHFDHLEKLSISHNPFGKIDIATNDAFKSLISLKILDMSQMEIEMLPDEFLHSLTELETFNISDNQLTEIPETLRYATKLNTLILDDNPIEQIGGQKSFPKLKNLQILSISDLHDLRAIGEGAFSNLPNLTTLHCESNHLLSRIHPAAFSTQSNQDDGIITWPPLTRLYLRHNNLSTLDYHLVGKWDDLLSIDIRNNNWLCDCTNEWLITVLVPMIEKRVPAYATSITCDHPSSLVGKELLAVSQNLDLLECSSQPRRNVVTPFIAYMLGILTSLIVIGLFITYRNGCFGLLRPSSNRGAAAYSRQFYSPANDDQFGI